MCSSEGAKRASGVAAGVAPRRIHEEVLKLGSIGERGGSARENHRRSRFLRKGPS